MTSSSAPSPYICSSAKHSTRFSLRSLELPPLRGTFLSPTKGRRCDATIAAPPLEKNPNADDQRGLDGVDDGNTMTHDGSSDSSEDAKRRLACTSLICPLVSVSFGSPMAKCPPRRRRDPSYKLRGRSSYIFTCLWVLSTRLQNVYTRQQARATAKVSEPKRVNITSFIISNTGYAFSHLRLTFLDPSLLGVVYSDLGTSPLYTLNGIWPANGPLPSAEDVIGGVSAIIWAITLLPLIKYVSGYRLSLNIYLTM